MKKLTHDTLIRLANASIKHDPAKTALIAPKAARLAEEISLATMVPRTFEGGGIFCSLGVDRWDVEVEGVAGIYTFPEERQSDAEIIALAAWTAARAIVEDGGEDA